MNTIRDWGGVPDAVCYTKCDIKTQTMLMVAHVRARARVPASIPMLVMPAPTLDEQDAL